MITTFMDRNPALRTLIAKTDITPTRMQACRRKAGECYESYVLDIANGEQRTATVLHPQTTCSELVQDHATRFGFNEIETEVVTFLVYAMDMGRSLHRHVQSFRNEPQSWRSNVEASLLVTDAFTGFENTEFGAAMALAIQHGCDDKMPSLMTLGGSLSAHALASFVRDFDIVAGFEEAQQCTDDPAFMRRQTASTPPPTVNVQPTKQHDGIIPEELLEERFLRGRPFHKGVCQTDTTFALQRLSRLYDIENAEITDIALERGGPKLLFRFITERLEVHSEHQRAQLMVWARNWKNGTLID